MSVSSEIRNALADGLDSLSAIGGEIETMDDASASQKSFDACGAIVESVNARATQKGVRGLRFSVRDTFFEGGGTSTLWPESPAQKRAGAAAWSGVTDFSAEIAKRNKDKGRS